jgi:hypothetical protein
VKANLCRFVYHLIMYCSWRCNYQEGRIVFLLTDLAWPYVCAYLKPGAGFPCHGNFMFNNLR